VQREREQEDGLVSAYNEAGFNSNYETEDMPSSQVAATLTSSSSTRIHFNDLGCTGIETSRRNRDGQAEVA
jgi:hypothetical protein